ncbi:uncharacterized protein FIBRA_00844 [Fibroporia radiculosa]|uniref:Histidine kinase n=1 Tax=Fibroporia radiculosa TaxID=599839 RepID=J4H0S1_9APHY|nr:uncharacterized protein FIBRA_00844 [Fibroporia radiculosa]CCL98839.1 predicted protein [Fibroporia radiculosa]
MAIPSLRVRQCSFDAQLVVLSYCISWLGAYTSTQIIIHAKYTRNAWIKWLWTFLASLAYGFCAIWCMHFVGMLACHLDIHIGFDFYLTILSAVVAVGFTFAAFSSPYISDAIGDSRFLHAISHLFRAIRRCIFSCCPKRDLEAGYEALGQGGEDDRRSSTSQDPEPQGEEQIDYQGIDDDEREASLERTSLESVSVTELPERAPAPASIPQPLPVQTPVPPPTRGRPHGPAYTRRISSGSRKSQGHSTTLKSPPLVRQRSLPRVRRLSTESGSNSPSTASSSLSSSDSSSRHRQRGSGNSLSGTTLASGTTESSSSLSSWGESLHVGLSRETRLRIKARARERPLPTFGWRYWMKAHWQTITALVVVRAAVWGLALVMMHYCGMWAMIIPNGHISWDLRIVVLSYVVAFTLCLVSCATMEHIEVHFGRQVAFSTISAAGCCSMHYTGMAAATFYTYSAPAPPGQAGYPAYLPITIIGIAVCVCVVSNVVLAHSAINARNRMAEMILTKRRLWRIMAEKEAAEQANELKQQFISVASHEIRTPLHTVNGYCELLSRTDLTEEQTLYVSSIQQACHAINVIAGNVLDFSKLDRNNVELSARPVLMHLRKVVEDLARIQPSQPGVDVVISVVSEVPETVYLDETYTFRVLMNLLSNAQKFCEKGYICVSVSMAAPAQLMIQVRDTGCGIPTNFRDALFQPFRQADTSMTRARQGTGLGLSIVKHLVQRMSGTVDVESTEGEGTMFTVKLPVALSNEEQSRPDLLDLMEGPKPSSRKRLRVVHSDSRTEALFVELWRQHGHFSLAGITENSVEALSRNADAIWADAESVASSALLRAMLCARTPHPLPVYIVYSELHDLSSLEPEFSDARNAVLVKRPLILHGLREVIEQPEAHMGTHLVKDTPKVRFAIPAGRFDVVDPSTSKDKFVEKSPVPIVSAEEIELETKVKEKEKVLLVEDNLINQRLGRRLLEKLGYDVTAVNNGQQAIDAVSEISYYCCLMDCQMPVVDGFTATRKIRALEQEGVLPGHLPIIALTANVTTDSEDRCRQAGMDHFLPKPLVLSDLDDTLTTHGRSNPNR